MTTDKELADAYRLACQRLFMYDFDDAVAALKEFADELDPPQPEYPDGTIAWIHDSSGWRFLGVRCDRYWRMGDNNGATPVISDREVTKVEPLRVLDDGETAVKLSCNDPEWWRGYSSTARLPGTIQQLCSEVADALDAEAGAR